MGETIKKAENEYKVLRIVHDNDIQSPREDDNLGAMVCWHSRYSLGDDHSHSEPTDFLQALAIEYSDGETYKRIAKKKADLQFEGFEVLKKGSEFVIKVDGHNPFWRYTYGTFNEAKEEIEEAINGWMEDEALEEMENSELMEIIEEHIVILPLYLYDHSGITMSTSSFNDRWDSGQVGWIYVTKQRLVEEGVEEQAGKEVLVSEVEVYDKYLRGDVYGFILEEKDEDGEVVDEIDSCWGFYGLEHISEELIGQIGNENLDLIQNLEYVW